MLGPIFINFDSVGSGSIGLGICIPDELLSDENVVSLQLCLKTSLTVI